MNAKYSVYARRFAAELFGLKTRQFGVISKQRALWRSEMRSLAQRRRLVGHTRAHKNQGTKATANRARPERGEESPAVEATATGALEHSALHVFESRGSAR